MLYFVTITTAFFLLFTAVGWHLSPNGIWGLYTLTDGALAAWNSTSMVEWSVPFDPAPYNFLQGLGSQYIPNTPWLNPGALALSLPVEPHWQYYLSYSIYFLEVFGSTLVLGRTAGLSKVRSIVAAQILCLVIFPPYTSYFFTLPWISLAPFNAHLIAVCNLLLAAFAALGTRDTRGNLLGAAGVLALLVCAFYSAPVTVVTFIPAYAVFALAAGSHQPSKRSIGWKMGVIAAVGLATVLLRLPEYYLGTAQVTSSHLLTPAPAAKDFFSSLQDFGGAWKSIDWCSFPQISLCSTYPIAALHWAGLIGALIAALCYRGVLRQFGTAMLAYILFVHLYAIAADAQVLGIFNRINKDYMLFAAYPFYALFSVVTVFSPLDLCRSFVRRFQSVAARRDREPVSRPAAIGAGTTNYSRIFFTAKGLIVEIMPALAAMLLVPATAVWIMWDLPNYEMRLLFQPGAVPRQKLHMPLRNEVLDVLIREIGLRPGAPFRGFAATYFAGPGGPLRGKIAASPHGPSSTNLYIESRHYLNAHYGNSFMMTDLWRFNIPTFEEYGQWVTKPLYVFTREMFSNDEDKMSSWEPNLFRLDLATLRAIGVRFIITDSRLSSADVVLRATHGRGAGEPPIRPEISSFASKGGDILEGPPTPIYLYELLETNLGSFSPTGIFPVRTAAEAIAILKHPDFSPSRDVALHGPAPASALAAAIEPLVKVQRGGLRVTARSHGSSLLLLPVQFSNCLKLMSSQDSGQRPVPRIYRANLVETALLFEGELDITLSFAFGLGSRVNCRAQDVLDYQKMDFSAWSRH